MPERDRDEPKLSIEGRMDRHRQKEPLNQHELAIWTDLALETMRAILASDHFHPARVGDAVLNATYVADLMIANIRQRERGIEENT